MLQKLRNSFLTKCLPGLIALLVLNASVGAPDTRSQFYAEDLSFNNQETIVEMIFEKILDMEDAFAETEDNDPENEHKLKNSLKHQLFLSHFSILLHFTTSFESKQNIVPKGEQFTVLYREINSPPPEA